MVFASGAFAKTYVEDGDYKRLFEPTEYSGAVSGIVSVFNSSGEIVKTYPVQNLEIGFDVIRFNDTKNTYVILTCFGELDNVDEVYLIFLNKKLANAFVNELEHVISSGKKNQRYTFSQETDVQFSNVNYSYSLDFGAIQNYYTICFIKTFPDNSGYGIIVELTPQTLRMIQKDVKNLRDRFLR